MVLNGGNLFVADFNPVVGAAGRVLKYTLEGVFIEALTPPDLPPLVELHPRGVVIGPDQQLYVSNVPSIPPGLGGQVLRFDPASRTPAKVFISNPGNQTTSGDCKSQLNRPEGLVFGPDGNLYITSFRANAGDTDKILVFQGPRGGQPGACLGSIDLQFGEAPKAPRSFAQALLFGPDGDLFVPITSTGTIRRYKVGGSNFPGRRLFPDFVPSKSAGAQFQPWYLTFGKTVPGTLLYRDQ